MVSEDDTRADLIDPKLRASGWDNKEENVKVHRKYYIAPKRIKYGEKSKPLEADYVLEYKGRKLAVIEAKAEYRHVGEGVAQAKQYAEKLGINMTYSTNGKEIWQIAMDGSIKEGLVEEFPTPEELWNETFKEVNEWRERFSNVESAGPFKNRFYQDIAIDRVLEAIAKGKKNRLLLTLATGTGKTLIASQIAWKLFYSRWNLQRDGKRMPRILFLTDRNILASQAFNKFSYFPDDALIRVTPQDIRKKGRVPKNASIFFTIFQTFMSGPNDTPYFGEYPKDFFDLVIIDECHRGGANDESNWRAILDYFSPAVQLGLTATPKRKDNIDTYKYFGKPLYEYSLKEGIGDGFLTPFKVMKIKTTLDEYVYVSEDEVVEGEVEEGKIYQGADWNRIIEIKAREEHRVKLLLSEIDQKEKTIIFCATQDHALAIRDLINQYKDSKEPNYCVRVTANDGSLGDQYLKDFQDNEKTIPIILTTSQKLSTGVDARNIRNIVLMRPVNSIIEFKQIVGRGTRLFEGKYFFTIYDFVDAYKNFNDPEWDGEPLEPVERSSKKIKKKIEERDVEEQVKPKKRILKIKLRDGKEREIQHMISTSLYLDGKTVSLEEFINRIYGDLPKFFKNEKDLIKQWSNPNLRKALLVALAKEGYELKQLIELQKLIGAEKSDLFDVLEFISFAKMPITREKRVALAQHEIFNRLDDKQKEFLEFVLSKYIENGIEELDPERLALILKLKYDEISDAIQIIGSIKKIRETFIESQKYLYAKH